MKPSKQPTPDSAQPVQQARPARREYATPRLRRFGRLAELTQAAKPNLGSNDGGPDKTN